MDSRLSELEIKINLGEDQIEELNRTVFRQQQQIDLLQAQLRELYRLLHVEADGESPNPADERPPHY